MHVCILCMYACMHILKLQSERVFTNVSKGNFASSKDLQTAFQSTDQTKICQIILDKGQIQVSDMERNATLESTTKEIANFIATKCVHPVSNRPYTVNQIRDAMKKAEISVQPTSARSVKQQFLDCVRIIQKKKILEIQRAKMELAFVLPQMMGSRSRNGGEDDDDEEMRVEMTELQESLVAQLQNEANAIIEEIIHLQRILFLIDPSAYRVVDNIAKEYQGVKLEILRQTVTQEDDVDVSLELERNTMLQQQSRNDIPSASISQLQAVQEANNDFANISIREYSENADDDDDDEYEAAVAVNTRKKNKKAMKKSKKAKRREKEEASIRKERVEAEKARREERRFRLGLTGDDNGDASNATGECVPCATTKTGSSDDAARKSCTTCGGSFSPKEYRAHFKSDWHRYNQKLKMKGISPIDEKEFLLIDSDAFFMDGMM